MGSDYTFKSQSLAVDGKDEAELFGRLAGVVTRRGVVDGIGLGEMGMAWGEPGRMGPGRYVPLTSETHVSLLTSAERSAESSLPSSGRQGVQTSIDWSARSLRKRNCRLLVQSPGLVQTSPASSIGSCTDSKCRQSLHTRTACEIPQPGSETRLEEHASQKMPPQLHSGGVQ